MSAILGTSGLLYAGIYWLATPPAVHSRPLYFDFGDRDRGERYSGGAKAIVDLTAQHTQWHWMAGHDEVGPPSLTSSALSPGQRYDIGLELTLPQSDINEKAGVFMIEVHLLDGNDSLLAVSRRPSFLPFTTKLKKLVRMVFLWPLYLAGLLEEAHQMHIVFFDSFMDSLEHSLTSVKVRLSRSDIQLTEAWLTVKPQLEGLVYYMHAWFYTSAAFGILTIAALELTLLGFVYVFYSIAAAGDTSKKHRSDLSQYYESVYPSTEAVATGRLYGSEPMSASPQGGSSWIEGDEQEPSAGLLVSGGSYSGNGAQSQSLGSEVGAGLRHRFGSGTGSGSGSGTGSATAETNEGSYSGNSRRLNLDELRRIEGKGE
ncbi:unnamed protein product [Chrysoparadoxa australica]